MELFELLTDAVRCGPGTPAWDKAVEALAAADALEANASLLAVREKLEVAKDARSLESSQRLKESVLASVAAAARAESRGVRQSFERSPVSSRPGVSRWGARNLAFLAASAALVIASVGAIVVEVMMYNNDARVQVSTNNGSAMDGPSTALETLPDGWHSIGSLHVKLDHDGALRVSGGLRRANQSGGILRDEPLPQGQPFEVLATLHYLGASSVSPEIFITDSPAGDDSMSPGAAHDFVWTVSDDRPGMRLVDGTSAGRGDVIMPGQDAFLTVKLRMDSTSAIVETSDDSTGRSRKWSGPHQLAPDKDWHIGVRFVVHGTRRDDCVTVDSLHVIAY
ncbi:MAG: hypothetical protein ABSH22_19990 [Tepidisphaeraceae bacterium]